jgi:tetratricopeptide (TPR) repeat protein
MGNTDTDHLLEAVQNGSASQRENAIEELFGRARRSNEADDWNAAGLAFHFAGDHYRAIEIFEALIAHDPTADSSRLSLATCYSQVEAVEKCRHHLRYLCERASTQEMREIGRQQLEGYEDFLGEQDEERRSRRQLIQALRRKVGDPNWENSAEAALCRLLMPDDWEVGAYDSLARGLIQESLLCGDEGLAREALAVLERGTKAYPENVSLLEMLVTCLLRFGPEDRLNTAVNTLRRLAPDSKVLRVVDSNDAESSRKFMEEMDERVVRLQQTATGQDPELRASALSELRRIVSSFPNHRGYREKYAFALLGAGEKPVALEQAKRLALDVPTNHPAHFNLGQIFWHAGDPERGRHHLELSLRYARSDEDRRDVREAVATCEHWYGRQAAGS